MGHLLTPRQIDAILRGLPLYEHIGLTVEKAGDVLECKAPITKSNSNHLGGMHAAVMWAAAEALGGIAYTAHPEFGACWFVVREVSISFKRVARTDIRARALFDSGSVAAITKQLVERGKAEYLLDVEL